MFEKIITSVLFLNVLSNVFGVRLNLNFECLENLGCESTTGIRLKRSKLHKSDTNNRIAPDIIRANSDYHVAVSLHESLSSCQIRVGVQGVQHRYDNFRDLTIQPLTSQLVRLQTGYMEPGQYELVAEGLSGIDFHDKKIINFHSKNVSILVQTDRALYKPGDLIRFRVLILDMNMKPLSNQEPVQIYIEDGAKNLIRQWRNITISRGVFSDELRLSSYPVLGTWHIVVESGLSSSKYEFELADYVLPKFDVQIDTPEHQYYRQGKIRATIRAKYHYGKPVQGEVTVSVYPKIYGSFQPFISNLITRKVMKIDGKTSVEFDIADELNFKEDYEQGAIMEAVVEEELNGRKQNVTRNIFLHKSKYKILFADAQNSYKPGLPYTLTASVQRFDGTPVIDGPNEILVRQASSYFDDDENVITETRHTIDAQGFLHYSLIVPHSKGFTLKFIYRDAEEKINWISAVHSNGEVYLKAILKTEKPRINNDVVIDIQSNENMRYLSYQVLGRGDIILTNTLEIPNRKNHVITFIGSFAMVPKAQFIVHFVKDDAIISDRIEIEFNEDLQNFVELDLSTNQASPGQEVDITVISKPYSYVGLMGIDQNAFTLRNSANDLNKKRIFSELSAYEKIKLMPIENHYGAPNRWEDFTSSGVVLLTNAQLNSYHISSLTTIAPYENEILSSRRGLTTVKKTDIGPGHILRTQTRPPLSGPYAFSRIPKPYWDRPRVHIMNDISDTWLFINFSSGHEGRHTIHKKIPESITSWIITGFALDAINGIGIMKQSKALQVFQPFSISLDVPFSVKRGEIISIPVALFNYLDSSQQVEITLHNTDQELEFVKMENEIDSPKIELYRRKIINVDSNEAAATSFMIKPKKLGPIVIKASARSSRAGDTIIKILKVEPEGASMRETSTVMIDLRDKLSFDGNISVVIPKNAIPDSTRIEVSVGGDLLGRKIKNMETLIGNPSGGSVEQNLLSFASNIVILNYLQSTNQLTEAIESKTKQMLELGYQHQLSYRHGDGSFSAFGSRDESGSTWLTAFAVRSFIQAQTYIQIDPKTIDEALEWLSQIQAPNGSFPEVGRIISSDMQGGGGKGIALSAYVLVAFLEDKNRVGTYHNFVNKAIDHVVRNLEGNEEIYALAVASYALQLANHNSKNYILQTLDSKSIRRDGRQWWEKPIPPADSKNIWLKHPNSVNIEMTSYGCLALMEAGLYTEALPVIKWLINQQNEIEFFHSPQDTLRLYALSKFAQRFQTNFNDIQLSIKYNQGVEKRITVNRDNSLIQQTYELPNNVQQVNISASGRGIAILQLTYSYNMNVTLPWPRFTLDPQPNKNSHSDFLQLTVCTSFVPAGPANESNLAVMEVELPSGFTADLDTLPSLEVSENVRKVETKNGDSVVIIYFDHLSLKEVCPTLDAFRTQKIAKLAPAAVTLYDYFDNSRRARQFYRTRELTLCDICEGSDCTETCQIRASERRSAKSIFDDEEEAARVMETSASSQISLLGMQFTVFIFLLSQFLCWG